MRRQKGNKALQDKSYGGAAHRGGSLTAAILQERSGGPVRSNDLPQVPQIENGRMGV